MDRDTSSPEPLVYSFIHLCLPQSPKRSPPTYEEKHKPHADRRPTYSGVRPGSPRGYDRRNWKGAGETMPLQYFLYLRIAFFALS
jgi:hypothetical protein